MIEAEFKPFYLESISEVDDDYFILDIIPENSSEDYFHELHIKAESQDLAAIKRLVGAYIYFDLMSSTRLEVYVGEFYEESTSETEFDYTYFEIKTIEKSSKHIWKPKHDNYYREFKKIFDQKVNTYDSIRNQVVKNYQQIYLQELRKNNTFELSVEEINKTHLFQLLYQLFQNNPPWDGLGELVFPHYLTPKTFKDWELAYKDLVQAFKNLNTIDITDYSVIKHHMIVRYKRSFYHMLPNLKYNHENIDERKYKLFFEHLIERLNQT